MLPNVRYCTVVAIGASTHTRSTLMDTFKGWQGVTKYSCCSIQSILIALIGFGHEECSFSGTSYGDCVSQLNIFFVLINWERMANVKKRLFFVKRFVKSVEDFFHLQV